MPEATLTAEPFLGGYSRDFDGAHLGELTDVAITSIAQPLGGRAALAKVVKSAWGCALPAPGQSVTARDGVQVLCLGPDTFFAVSFDQTSASPDVVTDALGAAGYYTDQSENWVTLRLSGPLAITALERICPIDLDERALPIGAFARTSMEHLGAIILREGIDQFILMSASSSAGSFLHAVETSIKYVI